jgi:hypothetical protein
MLDQLNISGIEHDSLPTEQVHGNLGAGPEKGHGDQGHEPREG